MDIRSEIIRELYKTVKLLGAKSDLLAILGSCGDTMTYEETLHDLREWNGYARAAKRKPIAEPAAANPTSGSSLFG